VVPGIVIPHEGDYPWFFVEEKLARPPRSIFFFFKASPRVVLVHNLSSSKFSPTFCPPAFFSVDTFSCSLPSARRVPTLQKFCLSPFPYAVLFSPLTGLTDAPAS